MDPRAYAAAYAALYQSLGRDVNGEMNPAEFASAYAALIESLEPYGNNGYMHAVPQTNDYMRIEDLNYLTYPESGLRDLWVDQNIYVYAVQPDHRPEDPYDPMYSAASTSAWQVLTATDDGGNAGEKTISSDGDKTESTAKIEKQKENIGDEEQGKKEDKEQKANNEKEEEEPAKNGDKEEEAKKEEKEEQAKREEEEEQKEGTAFLAKKEENVEEEGKKGEGEEGTEEENTGVESEPHRTETETPADSKSILQDARQQFRRQKKEMEEQLKKKCQEEKRNADEKIKGAKKKMDTMKTKEAKEEFQMTKKVIEEQSKKVCQEEKKNTEEKIKQAEEEMNRKIEEIDAITRANRVCDPQARVCNVECLAAAKKALKDAEDEAMKQYEVAMKEYKVLEKKYNRQLEIIDARDKRQAKMAKRESERCKEQMTHQLKVQQECERNRDKIEKEALKRVIRIEQEALRKARKIEKEAKKVAEKEARKEARMRAKKKLEEEEEMEAEEEAKDEYGRTHWLPLPRQKTVAFISSEHRHGGKRPLAEPKTSTKGTIDMATIKDLMEERMKLRTLMNESLDFMGAKSIEPIINPSIALYVDRGRKRREMMAEALLEPTLPPPTHEQEDTTRYGPWHDWCNKCCRPEGPDIMLPSCGPGVCENRMCKENKKQFEDEEEEEESESSAESDEEKPQFDRLELLGYDIIRMYPGEVMGACIRDPLIVYGPKRKPTNRDKRRKHVIGRDMFGMQHHRRRSVRSTLQRLPHECPFCILADKQRDNPRWRYQ